MVCARAQVIKNSDTGEEVAVNVNFGGGVESLTLRSHRHGAVRSVLWTHERNATAVALNTDWRGKMLIPCALPRLLSAPRLFGWYHRSRARYTRASGLTPLC